MNFYWKMILVLICALLIFISGIILWLGVESSSILVSVMLSTFIFSLMFIPLGIYLGLKFSYIIDNTNDYFEYREKVRNGLIEEVYSQNKKPATLEEKLKIELEQEKKEADLIKELSGLDTPQFSFDSNKEVY